MEILKKVLALTLACAQASAAVDRPLAAGPDVSDADFSKYVEAHGRRSLSEDFDANRPGTDFEERLRSKLETAQRAWLGSSPEKARTAFVELAELARRADWKDPQREVILYAHLRLAQSAVSPIERVEWLESAARLTPDLEPDSSLFPPPLLRELKELRATIATRSLPLALHDVFPGFKFVLVDGRKIDLASKATTRISPGVHRITALSDRHMPVTEELTAAQLGVFRVNGRPFAESCASPLVSLEDGTRIEVLNGQNCKPPSSSVAKVPDADWTKVSQEVSARPRRDWLWIGLAAVGTALAISVARDRQKGETTAVHREGF